MGHLQVVTRLSDQLYRHAWSVLGEFWGRGSGRNLITAVGTMAPGPRYPLVRGVIVWSLSDGDMKLTFRLYLV